MLNDFVYLHSQQPSPTCRHMGHCSLSLYLDGCACCEFLNSASQTWEPVSLTTADLLQPGSRSTGRGRALRLASRNH
jgi:hypothetical protein